MVNQPKRIQMNSQTQGTGTQLTVGFGPGTGSILRRMVNYHNIWWGFSVEPENADANANGIWVLWQKMDTNVPDTIWTQANLNSDNFNMQIIACGTWVAANQTGYVFSSRMSSSRNLVANQELKLTVAVHGVTAGVCRVLLIICASLTVK